MSKTDVVAGSEEDLIVAKLIALDRMVLLRMVRAIASLACAPIRSQLNCKTHQFSLGPE